MVSFPLYAVCLFALLTHGKDLAAEALFFVFYRVASIRHERPQSSGRGFLSFVRISKALSIIKIPHAGYNSDVVGGG